MESARTWIFVLGVIGLVIPPMNYVAMGLSLAMLHNKTKKGRVAMISLLVATCVVGGECAFARVFLTIPNNALQCFATLFCRHSPCFGVVSLK
jgi:hypothetical protein